MLFIFKNGAFRGRFHARDALAHIHQGDKTLTVAQAIAEGWRITTSLGNKGENHV